MILLPLFTIAKPIDKNSALQIAKNYYCEQTNMSVFNLKFEKTLEKKVDNEIFYYIFNVKDNKGFIIVSAEDKYFPIIGYSEKGSFITENQPSNIKYWMNQYVDQINYLRNNNYDVSDKIGQLWKKYNVQYTKFISILNKSKSVDPLVGDILWNQDSGWNDLCPEDGAGPGGHVYVGCVATAMGIIMKYWEYPIHGTGAHSYYIYPYGTQSVNFTSASYFWNNMDNNSPNMFSAYLLYHLGVSVDMGYSADGSGAYSPDVDDALEDYFQYSTDAQYVNRDGYYTQTEWINMLKGQIDAGRPVYYSGRDNDNGGHAFVCSGYNNSDMFHFNFGWSGSANGYYTVENVGGFHYSQAAVINIHPENSNVYPAEPNSLSCLLDNSDVNNFKVNIEWEAPTTKDVSSYALYRDFEKIAELNSDVFTYFDNTDAGSYYYSITAKYSTGEESLPVTDFILGEFSVKIYADDPDNGSNITNASVSFNNEEKMTTFVGASFNNVLYGGQYVYSISHPDYPTTSGFLDVTEDITIHVVMDGSSTKVENINNSKIELYPNPMVNSFKLKISSTENCVYEILNTNGQIVNKGVINSEKIINIKDISPGYYILKITTGKHVFTKPFIKN